MNFEKKIIQKIITIYLLDRPENGTIKMEQNRGNIYLDDSLPRYLLCLEGFWRDLDCASGLGFIE